MKIKTIALVLTVILSAKIYAEENKVLSCNFTEPFYGIRIASATEEIISAGDEVSFTDMTTYSTSSIDDVSRVDNIINATFTIDESKSYNLRINTDEQGSDGMSDKIYDFDALLQTADGENIVMGGCDYVLLPK